MKQPHHLKVSGKGQSYYVQQKQLNGSSELAPKQAQCSGIISTRGY